MGVGTGGTRAQLDQGVVCEFLGSTNLFRDAGGDVIGKVAPHAIPYRFKRGDKIISAGTTAEVVGVLFSGTATVCSVNPATGTSEVQTEIRVGDHFGEIAVLLGTAQPFEIVAQEDCTALLLGKEVVEQLVQKIAVFPQAMAKELAKRVVHAGLKALRAPPEGTGTTEPAPPPATDDDTIPFVRTSSYDIEKAVVEMVPLQLVVTLRILPMKMEGKRMTVGMVDPFNAAAIQQIRRTLSTVEVAVVAISAADFDSQMRRLKLNITGEKRPAERTAPGALIFDKEDSERDAEKAMRVVGDEVVTLSHAILAAALDMQASDIHIEEEASAVKIRYRVNGSLIDWDQFIPSSYAKSLVARFKVLSGLDITERRVPQDGRLGIRVEGREVDVRISTMPTSRGEKVVFRIFEAESVSRPLEKILFEKRTLNLVREVLNKGHGAVFVAGPTGSGKSSTLYACINEVKRCHPDKNICMAEDPIEYRLSGVTQVQVNRAVDFEFSSILRAFMRQDPDVIMVGEVRDTETAQMALEASLTGHLVLTSTHSHNSFAALQRLEKLGCSRTVLAQSLSLILVQQLVRRVCPRCVVKEEAPAVVVESLVERGLLQAKSNAALPKAVGCDFCSQTGFEGRVACLESLLMNDTLRAALMAGKDFAELRELAVAEGLVITNRQYASFLMAGGLITPGDALLTAS